MNNPQYPNGGTPPTTFKAVHAIHDHALAHTGTDVAGWLVIALVCVGIGLLLWGINRLGRS